MADSPSTSDRGIWRRVLAEARGYRLRTLLALVVELSATPLFLLGPIPLAIVVDSVIGGDELPSWVDAALPASVTPTQVLLAAAVLQVAVVLLADIQVAATEILRTHTTENLTLRLRTRLFAHVQRLSFAFHDRRGTSDSLYRIQYDTPALASILVDHLVPLVAALVTLLSVIFVIRTVDGTLALLALAVMPFLGVLAHVAKTRMRRQYKESSQLESAAMGVVHEVLGSFRVVKAFGRETAEQERFVAKSEESVRKKVAIAIREGVLDLLINLTTAIGTGAVLYIGAQRVQRGAITAGELLIVINYLGRLYTPLKMIASRVSGLQRSYESLQRSFELLDQEPDVVERPGALPLERARGAIDVRGVSFSYDGETDVLHDVTFSVPAGTTVGVAGATGSGKTTLVSLLLRFYDVDRGAIVLDDVDIRDYRLDDVRSQFTMVLQEPVLFATSIAENIAYGRPDASLEEIRAAAAAAGADAFISRLPDGYGTVVGERGQRLSGGERQRISLARAFLKDAPVLVLDEPTSSVDVDTEAQIMEAMERLMAGRTTFMIAHRLSTLDVCDVVLHVSGGTVTIDFDAGGRRLAAGGRRETA